MSKTSAKAAGQGKFPMKAAGIGTGLVILLGACSGGSGTAANPDDPYEASNRAVHEFNKRLDRRIVKPASDGYVAVVPRPVREGVSNGVENLGQPYTAINHALQGDFDDTIATIMRFGMNTVFGLGGLRDPATDAGLFQRDTDFGETLAVWGVPSGPYLETPFFGPSTVRDTAGRIVGFVADPVDYWVNNDVSGYIVAARVGDVLQLRNDLDRVIDALYYQSADSYTAARIAYLQNRSRSVNESVSDDDLEDPNAFFE